MENLIQKQLEKKKNSDKIQEWIYSHKTQIEATLPKIITPERFIRMVLLTMSKEPKLKECEPKSFLGAMLTAAQLGLEPNTPLGQAYLIPYKNKDLGTFECQFQIGYRGLLELCTRSGEITSIEARTVYENDEFSIEYGLNGNIFHKPAFKNKGNILGFYAVYHTKNGGYSFEFMSREDIEAHKMKYSKCAKIWNAEFEEMAKKTVIKKLLKYAPLRAEVMKSVISDESTQVVNFDEEDNIFVEQEPVIVNE